MRLNNQRGFTIIESLVALVVLSLSLGPMIAMATMSSNISTAVKNNLIGAMLAQEGIEIVRSIRDGNWLNGLSFDDNLISENSTGEWLVDSTTSLDNPPSDARLENPYIKIDPANGLYNYSSGEDTIFKRKIYITRISSNELRVLSEVTYKNKLSQKTITVESHLFDWR